MSNIGSSTVSFVRTASCQKGKPSACPASQCRHLCHVPFFFLKKKKTQSMNPSTLQHAGSCVFFMAGMKWKRRCAIRFVRISSLARHFAAWDATKDAYAGNFTTPRDGELLFQSASTRWRRTRENTTQLRLSGNSSTSRRPEVGHFRRRHSTRSPCARRVWVSRVWQPSAFKAPLRQERPNDQHAILSDCPGQDSLGHRFQHVPTSHKRNTTVFARHLTHPVNNTGRVSV